MAVRTSVEIDTEIEVTASERPEELGFSAGTSKASIYREIMRAGFRALREQRERAERTKLYQEWAQDEELHRSVRESADLAYEEGVL